METEDDYLSDSEREKFCNRSPLLKALLAPADESDPEPWSNALAEEVERTVETMRANMGEDFFNKGTEPLILMGHYLEISEDRELESSSFLTYIFTGIGYQLEDIDALNEVRLDILVKLTDTGFLDYPTTALGERIIERIGLTLLMCGAYWKKVEKGGDMTDNGQRGLNVFEDFLKSL